MYKKTPNFRIKKIILNQNSLNNHIIKNSFNNICLAKNINRPNNICYIPVAGPQGLMGIPGKNGSSILSGINPPSVVIGRLGDMFIDSNSGLFYIKSETGWVMKGNLKGDNGSKIYVDSSSPDTLVGLNNDLYIDSSTGDYYIKQDGTWIFKANIGSNNLDSSNLSADYGIPDDDSGSLGDFYLDRNTGILYYKTIYTNNDSNERLVHSDDEDLPLPNKVNINDDNLIQNNLDENNRVYSAGGLTLGAWTSVGSVNGSLIRTGSTNPSDLLGNVNDFYINTSSGDYFTKNNQSWVKVGGFVVSQNNSFTLNSGTVYTNDNDNSQRLTFSVNGSPNTTTTLQSNQTANRTLFLPDANDTLIGQNTIDTLTNKTLVAPYISTIINNGTLTLPTTTDTLIGKSTVDVLSNKSFSTPVTIFDSTQSISSTTGALIVNGGIGLNGNLNSSGIIQAANLSGTNSGDVVMGPILNSSNNNGATIVNQVLSLAPADNLNGGIITNLNQNIAGVKSLRDGIVAANVDASDSTKRVIFDLASATSNSSTTMKYLHTSNRVLSLPDATDTLIGKSTTDILSNKTLTAPILNNPFLNNGGLLSLPTSADTLVGRATIDTLSNKSFSTVVAITANTASTTSSNGALVVAGGVGVGGNLNISGNITAANFNGVSITINPVSSTPSVNGATASGQAVTLTPANATNPGIVIVGAQIYGGIKTFQDGIKGKFITATFADSTDNTKMVIVDTSASNTNTTTTLKAIQTTNRILTLPDSTDTLVGKSTTDTLSNKTLIAPTINNPILTNGGLLTLPTSTDTLVGRSTTDTLANKSFSTAVAISATTASNSSTTGALVVAGGIGVGGNINITGNITAANFNGVSVTIGTFGSSSSTNGATASGSIITLTPADASNPGLITASTQTIGGVKTFQSGFIGRHIGATMVDSTDNTKIIAIDISGSTTATTTTLKSIQTANRIITLPDATDTLIGKTTTDTLSNKSFNTAVTISDTTTSTSTTSGALTVAGGVGFSGNVYCGGSLNVNTGQLVVSGNLPINNYTCNRTTTGSGTASGNYLRYEIIVTINNATFSTISPILNYTVGNVYTISWSYGQAVNSSNFTNVVINRVYGQTSFAYIQIFSSTTFTTTTTTDTIPSSNNAATPWTRSTYSNNNNSLNGAMAIGGNINSISSTTGTLVVAGGIGITGNININASSNSNFVPINGIVVSVSSVNYSLYLANYYELIVITTDGSYSLTTSSYQPGVMSISWTYGTPINSNNFISATLNRATFNFGGTCLGYLQVLQTTTYTTQSASETISSSNGLSTWVKSTFNNTSVNISGSVGISGPVIISSNSDGIYTPSYSRGSALSVVGSISTSSNLFCSGYISSNGNIVTNNGSFIGGFCVLSSGIYLPSSGGSSTMLSYYEEYTANYYMTGPVSSTGLQVTIKIVRIGSSVTLAICALNPVVNSFRTSVTATFTQYYFTTLNTSTPSIPTRFQPSVIYSNAINVYNGNNSYRGCITILPANNNSPGIITIEAYYQTTDSSQTFTSGNNVGFDYVSCNYLVI